MSAGAEAELALAVDAAGFEQLVVDLASEVRLSGSPEEQRAFDVARRFLEGAGLPTEQEAQRSLVGYPLRGCLEAGDLRCTVNPHALAPGTGPDGLRAAVVDLGAATDEDYARADVAGKIVLCDGLGTPDRHLRGERAGAVAQIYVLGERFHEMIVSPVWGTATPETRALLPTTPSAAVLGEDGRRLRERLAAGATEVLLVTEAVREWIDIPTLTADVPGSEDDTFVLLSCHIDSWHHGAIDNATANATALVVAASLARQAATLRRGLRVAFWSGHSHARYAGSTWYVDTHWDELERRCVAHVNLDGLGSAGSHLYPNIPVMSPAFDFASEVFARRFGLELVPRPIPRAGDHSFMGLGIPALFNTLSEQPATGDFADAAAATIIGGSRSGGAGLGWFWHTTEDTVDRLGVEELVRDGELVLDVVGGLCRAPVLPLRYSRMVEEIEAVLGELRDPAVVAALGLDELAAACATTRARLLELEASDGEPAPRNRALQAIGQQLIPVVYTRAGRFDQDLALGTPLVPGLRDATQLAGLDPAGRDYQHLRVALLRQRNRIASALRGVQRECERLG